MEGTVEDLRVSCFAVMYVQHVALLFLFQLKIVLLISCIVFCSETTPKGMTP